MLFKILKKDLSRKKTITAAVFIFIMLSALLIASGSSMFVDLSNSLAYLLIKSNAPHFTQYHSGAIDQKEIDQWTDNNPLVKKQQTSEMINIQESNLYFKDKTFAQSNSVMETAFVKQNSIFDFLLDLDNRVIRLSPGEIAVPIYYRQKENLAQGDIFKIKNSANEFRFRIVAFVRDVQMNPSIVSSKRFMVHETDFEKLKKNLGDIEFLIGFQLNDLSKLGEFNNAYNTSNLPKKGPAIDYELLKIMNTLIDGLIASVIIFVSLLLNLIAILCLRFTILVTLEEDFREIGVMKAIGIRQSDIKQIYLSKYFALATSAVLAGYTLSLFLNKVFSANIMLYIGTAPKSLFQQFIPVTAAMVIFLIVIIFCSLTLNRFKKITAVEAIRLGNTGIAYTGRNILTLYKNRFFNTNIFLGIRDVILRFKLYILLFFVFFIATFIIIVPLNFLNTIKSPKFITYMGMGSSDILIDLRQSNNITERFEKMVTIIKNDPDVVRYSPLITCQYEVVNKEGYKENLTVETGNFTIFSIEYLKGRAPLKENEIALSFLSADELGKEVGDRLLLTVDNTERVMLVSGVYQDLTNGGRTAKAPIPPNYKTATWYMLFVDVNANINKKIDQYKIKFPSAKITDINGYLDQTFGNTVEQLGLLTILAAIIAVIVAILITSLFLKMLIAKDLSQIAIMKSLGLSLRHIQIQYITRAILVLNLGIIMGTILSNTFGQTLMSAVFSIVGAARIEFIINPWQAYISCPFSLIMAVSVTALLSIGSMKNFSIVNITAE